MKLRGGPLAVARAPARGTVLDRRRCASWRRRCSVPPTGSDAPPATEAARLDLRAYQARARAARRARGLERARRRSLGRGARRRDRARAGTRRLRPSRARRRSSTSCARVPAASQVVFVLGLEEGVFPQRTQSSPFLDDDRRRELDGRARLAKPDPVSRARYLFYTACTRPSRRLYLVREAATDDGAPRQPSPFWEDVARRAPARRPRRGGRAAARSRSSSGRSRAPRPSASGCARSRGSRPAIADAAERDRARERLGAAARPRARRLHPPDAADRARRCSSRCARASTFGVTELEAFAGCSSIWFVERLLDPRSMDAERRRAHARLDRAPGALQVSSPGCRSGSTPSACRPTGSTRRSSSCASASTRRSQAGRKPRLELTDLQRDELRQGLWRDLEALVRAEAESRAAARPAPLRGLVRLGALGARAPARPRPRHVPPLREDRPHRPRSVRGARDRLGLQVGEEGALSARRSSSELKLQIPLYMLVLRDLVGVEPLGGLYRPLVGRPEGARPAARVGAGRTACPAARGTTTSTRTTSGRRSSGRRTPRAGSSSGSASGDVRHDPRGGSCPSWCRLALDVPGEARA